MPAEHDYPDPALTENERLEHKRYQSAFAFEMDHPPVARSSVSACSTCDHGDGPMKRPEPRFRHFTNGIGEQFGGGMSTEDQYMVQMQQQQHPNYMRYQRGPRT